ncbi:MAG TPA: glycosyltransferase family 39 protein [Anaerolineales bacterium]|nr:glycosyltransferase family 39 protein [Anaerolineales bacterium]
MESTPTPPSREPSVLDWFKSLFRLRPMAIPKAEQPAPAPPVEVPVEPSRPPRPITRVLELGQLRLPAALVLALLGQATFEAAPTRDRMPAAGIVLYLAAAALTAWGLWRHDLARLSSLPDEEVTRDGPARGGWLAAGAALGVLTFLASGHNTFRLSTILFWAGSLLCLMAGFWEGENPFVSAFRRMRAWLRQPKWSIGVDAWALGFWLALGVAAYFRFVHLATLPLDMWSDQAEKLLDVADVLDGRYSIFFTRNTGREAIQFYMAAATAKWLGTGLTFLTLKIGTALAGWLTLPFLYLFAREIAGRRAALAAMFLAGVAMWPNVISRTGLRFSLYPVFAAPALWLLVRGLRRQSRNDLLLAAVVAGIGLHGYSPARALPLVLAAGVAIYALHSVARGRRARLIAWCGAAAALGLAAFLPLLRVALELPDNFLFRSMTRLGTLERPLPGPVGKILISNLWNGLGMFNWNSGQIWVVSIAGKPLLDWVTGALLVLGAVLCLVRYVRRRSWLDLFVLLSVPLLMLPSLLALAFPGENPAPNRASAALVPVFALAGWALVAVCESIAAAWPGRIGRSVASGWAGAVLLLVVANNFALTFDTFYSIYRKSAWNTSDGGRVIRGFAESLGDFDSAHVVPYAFWWDTRLVGIQAGQPRRDYALPRDRLDTLLEETGPQLILFNIEDNETFERLRILFPEGRVTRFAADIPGHDFMIYFVPSRSGAS